MNDEVFLPNYAVLDANVAITGWLAAQGWGTQGVTTVAANYVTGPADAVILANATAGPLTVALGDATQNGWISPGQRVSVVKTDASANVVTVTGSNGQLISGAASVTLANPSGYMSVVFDGANWWVDSGYTLVGTAPSGPAGGDLSGTYPNPTVTQTHLASPLPGSQGGTGVTGSGTPALGQVLMATSSSAAKWASHPVDWVNAVTEYGADPAGVSDSTTAFQNAASAAVAANAPLYIPGGTYKQTGTVSVDVNGKVLHVIGAGRWNTIITYSGTGDAWRIYDSSTYSTRTRNGGSFTGLTIDGTGSGAASSGLHMGDILQYRVDFSVQNFTGAGSVGAWFDNNYYWTEQLSGRVYAQNCSTCVQFDNSANTSGSATGSFMRMDMGIYIDTQGVGDGVTFANGAFTADFQQLGIWGNMDNGAAAYAALRLTGSNTGGSSRITAGRLDMGVELDAQTLATAPYTIYSAAAGNSIIGCYGMMDFGAFHAFTPSNIAPASFEYAGQVVGDSSLIPSQNLAEPGLTQTISANASTITTRYVGTNRVSNGGVAYTGLILQPGTYPGQTVTIVNSGNATMTFDVAATSHVADGTSDVIPALTARTFEWVAATSLWYRMA